MCQKITHHIKSRVLCVVRVVLCQWLRRYWHREYLILWLYSLDNSSGSWIQRDVMSHIAPKVTVWQARFSWCLSVACLRQTMVCSYQSWNHCAIRRVQTGNKDNVPYRVQIWDQDKVWYRAQIWEQDWVPHRVQFWDHEKVSQRVKDQDKSTDLRPLASSHTEYISETRMRYLSYLIERWI